MFIKNRESIIRAIEAKVGNKPCPMCGVLAGYMTGVDEHQVIGFDRTPEGLHIIGGEHVYIPCIAAICKNCGNVHMFALPILMDDPNYEINSL